MDLKNLNYFVQTAENLSFTKAAKNCYISQAAISLSIAKMEEELGFMLFERNNRSMRLTPAGRDFYTWACQTLRSYENAVNAGRNTANGYTGMMKIGFGSCFEALWFLPQLQSFRKQFRDTHLEQRITDCSALVSALKDRELDAVVAPPYDYLDDKALTVQPLANFPMIIVLGKQHPLIKMQTIPVSALNDQLCFILSYQGMPKSEQYFIESCKEHNIHFRKISQMDRIEEILIRLTSNDAVAFLPSFIANYLNDFVTFRPLENCDMRLTFSFCHLKNNKNPVLSALDLVLQQNYARRD